LWMAREASRFTFLVDFALAILAAYGAETLFSGAAEPPSLPGLSRVFKWVVIACAIALGVPAVFGRPEIHPWTSFSILMIFASYALFGYITRRRGGCAARFMAMALILSDLNAFNWSARNKIEVARTGTDQLDRLLSFRGAAAFVRSRAGPSRARVLTDFAPNVGDLFGVQTPAGSGVTMLMNYKQFIDHVPDAFDMLNVRYYMRPAAVTDPGVVYQDAAWKVYENPNAYPRAWLVHDSIVEPDTAKLWNRLNEVDPHHVAVVGAPIDAALAPASDSAREEVGFERYGANEMRLKVDAEGRALLVLSEVYYPGWQATVNDRPARIYEVDGALRGIVVGAGENRVKLRYAPGSIYAGALMTLLAFTGTLVAFFLDWRKRGRAATAASEATSVFS